MQRLIVDMDGVLADVWTQYLAYDERDTGRRKSAAEVAGIPELEAFTHAREYVRTPGFFRNAPVVPGSQRIMEQLNGQYEVFVVSAAVEFPQSLGEKVEW